MVEHEVLTPQHYQVPPSEPKPFVREIEGGILPSVARFRELFGSPQEPGVLPPLNPGIPEASDPDARPPRGPITPVGETQPQTQTGSIFDLINRMRADLGQEIARDNQVNRTQSEQPATTAGSSNPEAQRAHYTSPTVVERQNTSAPTQQRPATPAPVRAEAEPVASITPVRDKPSFESSVPNRLVDPNGNPAGEGIGPTWVQFDKDDKTRVIEVKDEEGNVIGKALLPNMGEIVVIGDPTLEQRPGETVLFYTCGELGEAKVVFEVVADGTVNEADLDGITVLVGHADGWWFDQRTRWIGDVFERFRLWVYRTLGLPPGMHDVRSLPESSRVVRLRTPDGREWRGNITRVYRVNEGAEVLDPPGAAALFGHYR